MEDRSCKIVLVGDSRCGKTALIHRFTTDKFLEVYTPTGFERYAVNYEVCDTKIHFTIWDTSGACAYDTVRPLAYQDAKVFLLCFHIADVSTLDNTVNKWYPEVRKHCPSIPVILCGCQSDLRTDTGTVYNLAQMKKSPVSAEQAVAVSRQIGATTYVETSSKQCCKTVPDAFEIAALAAMGKLNKSHGSLLRHRPFSKGKHKNKTFIKEEIRHKAKNCVLM